MLNNYATVVIRMCYVSSFIFTLRAKLSGAVLHCTVIGPVCLWVCLFVGLLPR